MKSALPTGPTAALTSPPTGDPVPVFGPAIGASFGMMLFGGGLLVTSLPTFVLGNWLLIAAGCTLVHTLRSQAALEDFRD